MAKYSDLPFSTTHDLFIMDYSDVPTVNKRVHRKKNDFTEYTEEGARNMKVPEKK
jgi:hypothetical protein